MVRPDNSIGGRDCILFSSWSTPAAPPEPSTSDTVSAVDGFQKTSPRLLGIDPRPLGVPSGVAGAEPEPAPVAAKVFKVVLLAGLAVISILGIAGCGPANTPTPPDGVSLSQAGRAIDTMKATQSSDYMKLQIDRMDEARVDIHRETRTVVHGSGKYKYTETKVVELSPFGINLGNGLFFDGNGNITFNPYVSLRGEPFPNAKTVRIEHRLAPTETLSRSQEGTSLRGFLGITSRIRGNTLEQPLEFNIPVAPEGNGVALYQTLSLTTHIQQDGATTTIKAPLSRTWTITRINNRITFSRSLTPTITIDLWENAAVVHQLLSPDVRVEAGQAWMTIRQTLDLKTNIREADGKLTVEKGLSREVYTAEK